MIINLEKAGTNPEQALTASISGLDCNAKIKVGEVLHVTGQPEDVKWRITSIVGQSLLWSGFIEAVK